MHERLDWNKASRDQRWIKSQLLSLTIPGTIIVTIIVWVLLKFQVTVSQHFLASKSFIPLQQPRKLLELLCVKKNRLLKRACYISVSNSKTLKQKFLCLPWGSLAVTQLKKNLFKSPLFWYCTDWSHGSSGEVQRIVIWGGKHWTVLWTENVCYCWE